MNDPDTRPSWLDITAIIATRNDAAHLGSCLNALKPGFDYFLLDIVVADAGSTDGTPELARQLGAEILDSGQPRGQRLNDGALLKGGNWMLFLRPSSVLEPGWIAALTEFVQCGRHFRHLGYFRPRLADRGRAARRMEMLINMRARIFGRPLPEQGLFMSHRLFEDLGGFRADAASPELDLARRAGWSAMEEIDSQVRIDEPAYHGRGAAARLTRDFPGAMIGR